MNTRPARRTRPSIWHSTASTISTSVSFTTTNDPLASAVILPMPTLSLVFGGKMNGDFALTRAMAPRELSQPSTRKAAGPARKEPEAPKPPHRIELSIDSLPNHLLIEPIPVAIDPVGDTAFTAWMPNLEMNATGQSVVEALLLLKERIEFVYDDLNKKNNLSPEQKTLLQMMHTYIAPQKPEWQY